MSFAAVSDGRLANTQIISTVVMIRSWREMQGVARMRISARHFLLRTESRSLVPPSVCLSEVGGVPRVLRHVLAMPWVFEVGAAGFRDVRCCVWRWRAGCAECQIRRRTLVGVVCVVAVDFRVASHCCVIRSRVASVFTNW